MSEEQPKRSYYAILTAEVRYDKELPPMAKLLYAEITALSNEYGYCWASNGYFAELYGMSADRISKLISALAKKDYIRVEVLKNPNNKFETQRHIFITNKGVSPILSKPVEEKKEEPKKVEKVSFKKEEYKDCLSLYSKNADYLYDIGKLKTKIAVFNYPMIQRKLKSAFELYGIDAVKKAIEVSVNDKWLVDQGYQFSFILGPSVLPRLINGQVETNKKACVFDNTNNKRDDYKEVW